jgi:hypothetical protein
MQVFGSIVMLILIFAASMWLRGRFLRPAGQGRSVPRDLRAEAAAESKISDAEYERLDWELKQRGFVPRDPRGRCTDFEFSGQLAVEVVPAGAGLYRVSVRNGVARSAADEALWVARNAR